MNWNEVMKYEGKELLEKQTEYWNNQDPGYVGPISAKEISKYFDKLIKIDEELVLDFGCGIGRIYEALKPKNYIGVDISENYLKKFKEKYPNIKTIKINNGLPNDQIFDVVISYSVFTHMKNSQIEVYIEKLANQLKTGGKFVVSIFDMDVIERANWTKVCKDYFIYLAKRYNLEFIKSLKVPEQGGDEQTLMLFNKI